MFICVHPRPFFVPSSLQLANRIRRPFPDDGRPRPNPPARDQSVDDVWIGHDERFHRGGRVAFEEQHRAVDRIGERAAQEELPALGRYSVSIEQVVQEGRAREGGGVPVMIITHACAEAAVRDAIRDITRESVMKGAPLVIRIEDV